MFPVRVIQKKYVAIVYPITYTAGRHIEHPNANIYNPLHEAPRTSTSNHLHNLAAVDKTSEALRVHFAVSSLACQELVPPPEQEVAGDELEPRREGIR